MLDNFKIKRVFFYTKKIHKHKKKKHFIVKPINSLLNNSQLKIFRHFTNEDIEFILNVEKKI